MICRSSYWSRKFLAALSTLALGLVGAGFWQPAESVGQPGRCLASVASYVYCQGLRPQGLGSRCCWPWGHPNACAYWLTQYPPIPWGKSAWGGACVRKSHIIYHK